MSRKYKWHKGDKVRLVNPNNWSVTAGFTQGMVGTIKKVSLGAPKVKFEDKPWAFFDDEEIELIQSTDWKPVHLIEGRILTFDVDIFGEIFVTNGKIVARTKPEYIDKTWTHWRPTGITSLPNSEAKDAFEREWEPHQGSHKSVAEEWFIKGYNKGKESK